MNDPFSFSTVKAFDNHIDKSIHGYGDLTEMVIGLAEYVLIDGTNVYDIGCSTGKLLQRLDERYSANDLHFYGIEKEFNFVKDQANSERISFLPIDVTGGFKFNNASLIASIFTLQFIQPRHRRAVLRNAYEGLNAGGAFIFAEKIYSAHSHIQDMFTFLYYEFKKMNFSVEEIFSKERALRSLMKPLTLDENQAMLEDAGFRTIDVFWRHWNFVAFVCVKG